MLTEMLDALTRTPRRALATAAVATVVAALPLTASAHPRVVLDVLQPVVVVDSGAVVGPVMGPLVVPAVAVAQPVWVEPVYRTVIDRQWVAPVYQTVTAHVWVEPVTVAAAPERVFVPDQFGWQAVVVRDGYGRRHRDRQWVLVSPAHYEDRATTVVVTPGHYAEVAQQQLVADGHWASVEHQELVTPGHWEPAAVPVVVPDVCPPRRPGFRLRLPF